MYKIERILVPVDFSRGSRFALEYAGFLARQYDAVIEVLHVVRPPPAYVVGADVMMYDLPGRQQSLEDFTQSSAKEAMKVFLLASETGRGENVQHRFADGNVPQNILKLAEEEAVDIIVMGTHGRTGFMHAVLGSVAEKVVRKSTCPVLTISEKSKGV